MKWKGGVISFGAFGLSISNAVRNLERLCQSSVPAWNVVPLFPHTLRLPEICAQAKVNRRNLFSEKLNFESPDHRQFTRRLEHSTALTETLENHIHRPLLPLSLPLIILFGKHSYPKKVQPG
jgi:hypothetical protein